VKFSDDNALFYTGHSNGTIQQWDFKTGQIVQTFNSATKSKKGKPSENLMIWTLCVVDKKYLISGNSKGTLSVWDSQFGVLIKDFNEHDADILSTCVNKETKTIYFTGSNSLICTIQLVQDEWKLTSKFRGQSHDINSICLLK
jgi:U3 small nucleolar RNA-associated protein 4